jgi:hypothetical protein
MARLGALGTAIVGQYVDGASLELVGLEIVDVVDQVARIHLQCP